MPAAGTGVQVLFWVEATGNQQSQPILGHMVGQIRRAIIESVAI